MIGKVIDLDDRVEKSNSDRMASLCDYVAKPDIEHEKVADVWFRNVVSPSTGDAEMAALAGANPRARLPMRHIVLSWRKSERPSTEQAKEAAETLLAQIGCSDCLSKCALHYDTDNVHLHVAVCTVHPETERMVKTSFLHEAVLQAVALVEAKHGWMPEANARYAVIDGKAVRTSKAARTAPAPSERAQRKERFSGQRSAEDIAREVVQAALAAASSWRDLHAALVPAGLEYQLKGSGAVIAVQQDGAPVYIKASKAHRGAALSKLEAKFGAFEASHLEPAPRSAEPVQSMHAEAKALWQQYKTTRTMRRVMRRTFEAGEKESLGEERRQLSDRQRRERDAVGNQDWTGRGELLIALRSAAAAKHATERQELKLRAARRRKAERSVRPGRSMDFETWLSREACREDLARGLRGNLNQPHPGQPASTPYPGQTSGAGRPGRSDLLLPVRLLAMPDEPAVVGTGAVVVILATLEAALQGYQTRAGRWGTLYVRQADDAYALIDTGSRVKVPLIDDHAVRAALAVAAGKWERLELNGSDEFKRVAVRQAVRLGLAERIDNPELQPLIRVEQVRQARVPADHARVAAVPASSARPDPDPLSSSNPRLRPPRP